MVHRGSALGSGGNGGVPKPIGPIVGFQLIVQLSDVFLVGPPIAEGFVGDRVRVEYQKQLQDFRNAERVVGHGQSQYVAVG